MNRWPRPYRVRELQQTLASWRIVTVATKPSWIAARTWIRCNRPAAHRCFIDHREAPASLDHINPAPASR